jgi:glutathione S-transferase
VTLKLFEHPLSPYARKVKIVLYEKELPFERLFVNPSAPADDAAAREWRAASPRLEVPALVDGDVRVFDSTIILDYVEETHPVPPAMPSEPAERARVRMLEEVCDTELEAIVWGLMEVRFFGRAQGEHAEEMAARAGEQLERIWARLERELEGREWMNGERFGRGDAAVYPPVAGAAFYGFGVPDRFPRLKDWVTRAAARPSVRRDTKDLSTWLKANMGGGASASPMPIVRQYRDHRLEWMMKSGGVDIVLEGIAKGTIRFAEPYA